MDTQEKITKTEADMKAGYATAESWAEKTSAWLASKNLLGAVIIIMLLGDLYAGFRIVFH